jgi:GNAT superfamily N-acetyltransferase
MLALRAARPGDAGPLARLFLASRRAALPGLREPWDEPAVAGWMLETLIGRHSVLLAEKPDGPVAYAGFGAAEGVPTLFHLYVAPGAWRRGLGSRLLRVAMLCAPGRLRLHAFQRNHAARAFYAWHGFAEIALGDAAANEEGEADVLLEWTADRVNEEPST